MALPRYNYSYGTVATGIAWFEVIQDSRLLPAWTAPVVSQKTLVFPGSDPPRSETQIISIGVSTLTWRLWFPALDEYWAMLAKLATTDTLTVLANQQSHRGAYIEAGRRVELPGTTLIGLDADAPEVDGRIEAVAVFQRHIDPRTGYLTAPSS